MNMKKKYIILTVILLAAGSIGAQGQSWKDLFSKDNIKEAVGSVVEQLDIIPENITGEAGRFTAG